MGKPQFSHRFFRRKHISVLSSVELKHMLEVVSYLNIVSFLNGRLIDHIIQILSKINNLIQLEYSALSFNFSFFCSPTLQMTEVSGGTAWLMSSYQICWWQWVISGNSANLFEICKAWLQFQYFFLWKLVLTSS